jgi:uncharacterized protein YqhQ
VRLAAHAQMLPVLESGEETLVGGQAVMEGVMMRAPHSYCVAVRKANGEIVTEANPIGKVSEKYAIFKYPIARGIGVLGQAMFLGMKALRFSANAALDEGEKKDKPLEISGWVLALNLVFSLGFFIFLYKFVPLWLATRLSEIWPALHGRIAFNLTDGLIRLGIFLVFLWSVSRWREIRRVFQYHGAEHKVVFNYEAGRPVTVENAQAFPTLHPRCGTSFLLVVMMMAIFVYTLVPFDGFAMMFVARILLLPVIAGFSYEVIRYAAKRRSGLMAALTAPGLWLQRITTQPPSDEQTAVAIAALNGAMALEEVQGGQLIIA